MKKVRWGKLLIFLLVLPLWVFGGTIFYSVPVTDEVPVGGPLPNAEEHQTGAIFEPEKLTQTNPNPATLQPLVSDVSLAAYSLRDDYVIYTQDQAANGLCWAFASSTALSTTLMMATRQYYDFSEAWVGLAYALYNSGYQYGGGGNATGFNNAVNKYGLLLECDLPYEQSFLINNTDKQAYFDYYCQFADNTIMKNVTPVTYAYHGTLFGYTVTLKDQIQKIKNHIYNYGALSIGMYWNSYAESSHSGLISTSQYIYKAPCVKDGNTGHAVTLIGWDDNYSLTYNGKSYSGAWICLNSWSSDSGNDGVFYVMYDDTDVYGYVDGYQYTPVTDSSTLSYSNSIKSTTGYRTYKTPYAGKYYKPYTTTTASTLQRNLYFTDDVDITYNYTLTSGAVQSIKVYHGSDEVTDQFNAQYLNPDNNDFRLVANDLRRGPYKIVVQYANGTASGTAVNIFYVMDGAEIEQISCGLGGGVGNNGYYLGFHTFNYANLEFTLGVTNAYVGSSCTIFFQRGGYTTYESVAVGACFSRSIDTQPGTKTITLTTSSSATGKTLTIKINVVLVANSGKLLTLHYQANGGTLNQNPTTRIPSTSTGADLPIPTRDGYLFAGWYSDKSCNDLYLITNHQVTSDNFISLGSTSDAYAANYYKNYLANSRVAFLYARWVKAPTVGLTASSTTATINRTYSLTVKLNDQASLGSALAITNVTWYRNQTALSGTAVTLSETWSFPGKFAYYAKVNYRYRNVDYCATTSDVTVTVSTPNVNIKYQDQTFTWDNLGGTTNYQVELLLAGANTVLYSASTPDCCFNLANVVTEPGEYIFRVKVHDITETLSVNFYQVTYHQAPAADTTALVDATTPVTLPTTVAVGYDLVAWYTDPAFTNRFTGGTIHENLDLYAQMTIQPLTLPPINNVTQTYRNAPITITVKPTHPSGCQNFTYHWYMIQDGIPNELPFTGNTLTVQDVTDSGLYRVDVTLTDAAGQTATATSNQFNIRIMPLAVTINTSKVPVVYTYNGQNQTLVQNAVCYVNNTVVDIPLKYTVLESEYTTGDCQFRDVPPNQTLTMLVELAEPVNYTATAVKVTIRIFPLAVTVRVNNDSSWLLLPLHKLTYTITGVTPQDLAVTLSTDANGWQPGSYRITATVADNPNYTVKIIDGTYTVTADLIYGFMGSFGVTVLLFTLIAGIMHQVRKAKRKQAINKLPKS